MRRANIAIYIWGACKGVNVCKHAIPGVPGICPTQVRDGNDWTLSRLHRTAELPIFQVEMTTLHHASLWGDSASQYMLLAVQS